MKCCAETCSAADSGGNSWEHKGSIRALYSDDKPSHELTSLVLNCAAFYTWGVSQIAYFCTKYFICCISAQSAFTVSKYVKIQCAIGALKTVQKSREGRRTLHTLNKWPFGGVAEAVFNVVKESLKESSKVRNKWQVGKKCCHLWFVQNDVVSASRN